MKKTIGFLLVLLYTGLHSFAQKQNANWRYHENDGLSFQSSPPSVVQSALVNSIAYPATVSDSLGNLLFYTDGKNIWNRQDKIMPNGMNIVKGVLSPFCAWENPYNSSSPIIIPMPGNQNRYYVFALVSDFELESGVCVRYATARYSVVDMTLDGGRGDIVPGIKDILLYRETGGATMLAIGNGHCHKWLVAKRDFTDEMLAFKITDAGINNLPVVSKNIHGGALEMEASNDNKKIATNSAVYSVRQRGPIVGPPMVLYLYDFDVLTGILSNEVLIDTTHTASGIFRTGGMCFSADNSKLYVHEDINPAQTPKIYQYDIKQPTGALIRKSKNEVFSSPIQFRCYTPELSIDNKIYLLRDSNYFMVIHHPDKAGKACDARLETLSGIKRNPYQSTHYMHTWVPVTRIHYSYSDFNTCTFPTTLRSHQETADSYTWSTGATTPDLTINQNGTYWVKAAQNCGAYRVDTFHVNFQPPIPIADTYACEGQAVTISTDPQAVYKWGSAGPHIAQSGIYTVTISKEECGSLEDTFGVIIYPPIGSLLLPDDTVICNPEMQINVSSGYFFPTYEWNTGAQAQTIHISQPGKYWLSSDSPCGLFTDTVMVNFCKPEIKDISFPETICINSCIDITLEVQNYPQQYQWTLTGGIPAAYYGNNSGKICYQDTGIFKIKLFVSNAGGVDSIEKNIKVLPVPVSMFRDKELALPYRTSVVLKPCADADSIEWYKDGKLVCSNCKSLTVEALKYRTKYTCIIWNGTCSDSCHYEFRVTDIPSDDIWIPTGFTPNGDGRNDYFRPLYDNPNVDVRELAVYNRWGQKVYSSNNDGNRYGWDGTINGIKQNPGTYFWILRYRVAGYDEGFVKKGDITLIR